MKNSIILYAFLVVMQSVSAQTNTLGRSNVQQAVDYVWTSKPVQYAADKLETFCYGKNINSSLDQLPNPPDFLVEKVKKIALELGIDISRYKIKLIPIHEQHKFPGQFAAMIITGGSFLFSSKWLDQLNSDEIEFLIKHELTHIKHNDIQVTPLAVASSSVAAGVVGAIAAYALLHKVSSTDGLLGASSNAVKNIPISLLGSALGAYFSYKKALPFADKKITEFIETRADTMAAHLSSSPSSLLKVRKRNWQSEDGYLGNKEIGEIATQLIKAKQYGDISQVEKDILDLYLQKINMIQNDPNLTVQQRDQKIWEEQCQAIKSLS